MTDSIRNIQKLPYSIIQRIISYTYNIQPKPLRDDIKSYFSTKCIIHSFYYDIFSWSFNGVNKNADLYCLKNDIIAYANNNKETRMGYSDFFFSFHNTSIENMDDVMNRRIESPSTITTINILWALFKPCERIKFISMMYNTDHHANF